MIFGKNIKSDIFFRKNTRDRGDGTYDIAYDDGERETRVEERLIKKKDGGSSDSFREGDKIEADYRGRGKFYPGKISRDRGDDTYDIDYDDGERETRVSKRLIRSKDGGSGSSDKLEEGDKVEARYRGREKYYPGKITRDRGDGTYRSEERRVGKECRSRWSPYH